MLRRVEETEVGGGRLYVASIYCMAGEYLRQTLGVHNKRPEATPQKRTKEINILENDAQNDPMLNMTDF